MSKKLVNILLRSSLRPLLNSQPLEPSRWRTQATLSLPAACPHLSFLSSVHLLNSKGPHETCNQGNNGQQQLIPGSAPKPVSKTLFSLTFQWTKEAPSRLSPVGFFYPKLIFVSLSPALIEVLSITWTHVVKSFLHESRTHTLQAGLRQTRSGQIPFPGIWVPRGTFNRYNIHKMGKPEKRVKKYLK